MEAHVGGTVWAEHQRAQTGVSWTCGDNPCSIYTQMVPEKKAKKFVSWLFPVYQLKFTHQALEQVSSPVLLCMEGSVPMNMILLTGRYGHNIQARWQMGCPGFWKEQTIAWMSLARKESEVPKAQQYLPNLLCFHRIPNCLLWIAGVKMFYVFSISAPPLSYCAWLACSLSRVAQRNTGITLLLLKWRIKSHRPGCHAWQSATEAPGGFVKFLSVLSFSTPEDHIIRLLAGYSLASTSLDSACYFVLRFII